MCGLVGLIVSQSSRLRRAACEEAVRRIEHRGPDGEGTYFSTDGHVFFGHRRLSIIDLSDASAQPFRTSHVVLAYNGEIYNYRQLRHELELDGISFTTSGDTEVVARAYETWGARAFERLHGMFAVALHDLRANTIVLARDMFGIKPLYVAACPGSVAFGSEVKSLAAFAAPEISKDGLIDYFGWGYPLSLDSVFKGIRNVAPGQVVELRLEKSEVVSRCLRAGVAARQVDRITTVADVEQALHGSVRDHMIADVPVAVALSGGLDSSVVAAIAGRETEHLTAFTATFSGERDAEVDHAKLVTRMGGLEHVLAEFKVVDLESALNGIAYFVEEPIPNPNHLLTLALGSAIRRSGFKVILVGEGSDEIFAGYPWHRLALRATEEPLGEIFAAFRARCGMGDAARYLRTECLGRMAARATAWESDFAATLLSDGSPSLSALLHYERRFQLQFSQLLRVDRLMMASGVEARVPYLYEPLLEVADSLPDQLRLKIGFWPLAGRKEKVALARAAEKLVPAKIRSRPKFGRGGTVNIWSTPAVAQLDSVFARIVHSADYKAVRQSLEDVIDWRRAAEGRLAKKEKLFLTLLTMVGRHCEQGFRNRPVVGDGIEVTLKDLRSSVR